MTVVRCAEVCANGLFLAGFCTVQLVQLLNRLRKLAVSGGADGMLDV